ncbi:MAG: LamG domain-containing protein [Flavobacteriales bacterium]|nr:LamG domain-containing protein [Flavobacteriales bacterium]
MNKPFLPTLLLLLPFGVAAQTPIHHWPLDATSGTVALDIAGGAHGTLLNNCIWYPNGGHHGGALQANGNNAYVALGPCDITTPPGDELTLSCWVRPHIVSAAERVLMAKSIGSADSDMIWSLSLVNNTAVRFRVRTAGTTRVLTSAPANIFSGAWYHVAGVYDGSEMRIYMNGALIATQAATGSIGYHPQSPATLFNITSAVYPYFGWIDDARIYGHALDLLGIIDLVIGNVSTALPESEREQSNAPAGPVELLVLDRAGRQVGIHRMPSFPALPIAGYASGSYTLVVQSADSRWLSHMVVP